jgi:O-antigen/teichoic acid export membrane protein
MLPSFTIRSPKAFMIRDLAKQTSGVFAQQIANAVLSLALTVVVARLLGPERQGVYVIGVLVSILLSTLFEGGVSTATVYFVSQQRFTIGTALRHNFILAWIWGAIGIGVFLLFFGAFGSVWLPNISWDLLTISLVSVPFMLLHGYVLASVQAQQRFSVYNILALLPRAILLLGIVCAALVTSLSAKTAMLCYTFSAIMSACVAWVWLLVSSPPGVWFAQDYYRNIAHYGLQAYAGNVLSYLSYRIDQLILNAMTSSVNVGLYAVAVGIGERLWMFSQTASVVIFPRVSKLQAESTSESTRVARWMVLLMVLLCIAVALLARPLVRLLFGEAYLGCVPALWMLLPGIVAISQARILSTSISARGKPFAHVGIGLISLSVNIAGNLYLIPHWQIIGASLASSLSYVLYAMLVSALYCRLFNVSWRELLVRRSPWSSE